MFNVENVEKNTIYNGNLSRILSKEHEIHAFKMLWTDIGYFRNNFSGV